MVLARARTAWFVLSSLCSVVDLPQPLQVFSYSRCSTCRRALAWLKDHGISHDVADITETPPSRVQLSKAFDQLKDRKFLFNTSGKSYRAIGAAAIKAMNDGEALDALAADGKLIKRPFVVTATGEVLVGFNPEVWSDRLEG